MISVKQIVDGGKVNCTFLGSWNNELTLTVDGGEIVVEIDAKQLEHLAKNIEGRLKRHRDDALAKLKEQAEVEA